VKGASAGYSSGAYSHPQMNDSMPADTLALDTDGNGLLDRIYVGDTGGVVWRADMANSNQSSWIVTPVLSVGRHASGFSGSLANDRRFLTRLDYAQTTDATVSFDAVIIGTGDRENPKGTPTIKNWFYMLKDRDITSSAGASLVNNSAYPVNHGQMADLTSNCLQNGACTEPSELSRRLAHVARVSAWLSIGVRREESFHGLHLVRYHLLYDLHPGRSASSTCNLKEGGGLLYAVKLQERNCGAQPGRHQQSG